VKRLFPWQLIEDGSSFRAGLDQSTQYRKAFMKFVSLRTKRADRQGKLNKPSRSPHEIHTYEELQRQIHEDLRVQHPEWVQPDGRSPMCDAYDARLMQVLDSFKRLGSNESVTAVHRVLEQALT
jgi:hypothetical protein